MPAAKVSEHNGNKRKPIKIEAETTISSSSKSEMYVYAFLNQASNSTSDRLLAG